MLPKMSGSLFAQFAVMTDAPFISLAQKRNKKEAPRAGTRSAFAVHVVIIGGGNLDVNGVL
jgi:hypothetical protein